MSEINNQDDVKPDGNSNMNSSDNSKMNSGDNSNMDSESIGHVVTADELTIDEAAIIREQDRLANEKKKKKAAKVRNIILIVIGVLILAVVAFFIWGRKLINKNKDISVKVEADINQTVTFVKVDSINGNEINYTVLVKNESIKESNTEANAESGMNESIEASGSQSGAEGTESGAGSSDGQRSDFSGFGGGQMPDMSSFGGEMPDMSSFGGEMPDMSNFSGGRPGSSGSKRPDGNGSQSGTDGTAIGSAVLTYDGDTYSLTSEKKTVLIPVGTVVTTKLGTETTFSRISAGDCLGIVTEMIDGEETVISVYIVG